MVWVPLSIRRRPGRHAIVTPHGAPSYKPSTMPRRPDPATVKALARAFRWKRMLDTGRYATVSDIVAKEKIDRGYVGTVLRLTLLAPDIVEGILNRRQPAGLGLPRLLEPFPVEWIVSVLNSGDELKRASATWSGDPSCDTYGSSDRHERRAAQCRRRLTRQSQNGIVRYGKGRAKLSSYPSGSVTWKYPSPQAALHGACVGLVAGGDNPSMHGVNAGNGENCPSPPCPVPVVGLSIQRKN